MPFSDICGITQLEWDETYNEVFKPAIEEAGFGYTCERSEIRNGAFTSDIIKNLRYTRVVLADVTCFNPNVMWELGVRHAISKRTIMVVRKEVLQEKMQGRIISDLRSYGVIEYSTKNPTEINAFRKTVKKLLKQIEEDPERSDSPVYHFLSDYRPVGDDIVHLEAKIKDIMSGGTLYTVEAIVLQDPSFNRVARTGGYSQSASTLIGDDTGEIRVSARGKQTNLIQKVRVGDRIMIFDAMARPGLDNTLELSLETYSDIQKVD